VAQKQVDRAIEAANAQILRSPANSNFYDLLGGALFHLKKDLGGAETALQKSVELDKHNADALIQLCQVLAMRGNIDKAIALGSDSLKENPRQPNLDILLGDLYVSRSDWKNAQNAYQSALANDSQNPVASIDLAKVILNSGGSFDVALALAQTALRGLPNSPTVAETLGWIYYQQGVYPLAVTYLQEALKLQENYKLPDGPEIHYRLGMAYEKANQAALARHELEQVLKNYPDYRENAEIKGALARLKS
ncbi:MAG: tetratricopeptide repeat protein, partial [Formivibrio sp.]|nr:tetratricopeptide repeat protein [Formivibrio sp.]